MFIAQHHEAYVGWEVYQRNLDTLRGGQGLLSGLLRCARCGRKLNIRYWGKQGTAARYLCSGDFQTGGRYCLGFGGATVDRRLSEVILKALSPYGLQASIAAIAQSRSQGSERRGVVERQLQQARYEAERAFAQYDQIDPGNRLVAEVLEQRWNAKLAEQQRVEQALSDLYDACAALTPANEASLRALGEDFASVWESDGCSMTLKKRIARTLIKEIVVDVVDNHQLNMIIHWHGGCHTAFSMPKPLSGAIAHKTALQERRAHHDDGSTLSRRRDRAGAEQAGTANRKGQSLESRSRRDGPAQIRHCRTRGRRTRSRHTQPGASAAL